MRNGGRLSLSVHRHGAIVDDFLLLVFVCTSSRDVFGRHLSILWLLVLDVWHILCECLWIFVRLLYFLLFVLLLFIIWLIVWCRCFWVHVEWGGAVGVCLFGFCVFCLVFIYGFRVTGWRGWIRNWFLISSIIGVGNIIKEDTSAARELIVWSRGWLVGERQLEVRVSDERSLWWQFMMNSGGGIKIRLQIVMEKVWI